jgi:hypothetical protein
MNIERYRCFGATALNGNDAAVVSGPELSGWSPEKRQEFTIGNMLTRVYLSTQMVRHPVLSRWIFNPRMHGALCVSMPRWLLLTISGRLATG